MRHNQRAATQGRRDNTGSGHPGCARARQLHCGKPGAERHVTSLTPSAPASAPAALQDSQDPNPLIRALAVRTMGCIRVDKITEYLCDPLQRCLKDEDPYVRKTAAVGGRAPPQCGIQPPGDSHGAKCRPFQCAWPGV